MAGGEKRRGLSKSCALLIVIAGIERYAFKGVASNLVTYLTDVVKMSNSRAATTVNTWSGFTFMLPLFSAPLVDTYWDRFFTILASSSLYFVGLVGLTLTAYAGSRSTTKTISLYFLYTSLSLVALGLGVLNPSLQAFGADQLDHDLDHDHNHEQSSEKTEVKSDRKSRFFQWWYFGVCAGSLLGVTVMAYIQDTFGWVLGFAIPTGSMLLLIFLFLCGCGVYVYADPGSDPKSKPFQTILDTIKGAVTRRSKITLENNHDLNALELQLQGKPLCNCSNTEATSTATTKSLADNESSKTGSSGLQTVKLLLRLLPIWTMLLMFAVIFQQPATFFTKQGMAMKRNIGPNFKIPPATLQSTITLSIILLMPLYDKVLIPMAKKISKNEKGITVMTRMGIGMFLSIIAIVIAALVERKRLKISKEIKTSPNTTEPLSIFWLLPQYILLGISDIFTVVGMQEFFYSEVPVRMRTMGFALYTSVFGVGSFVSAALISVIESYTKSRGGNWFADDMSEARLDKYYWLLALTSAISFLMYIVICKYFKSTSSDHQNDDKCDETC
ncbi:Protein NRT1/ PTR FAMILY 5.8 [Raphanus sativus]|uniref:Protein NRT1/ PTR FAMILY 5.8 n=1 Tax=Raphanus sativus TaxID=3726 RepID=A0A6J0K8R7_RAPSA|nr:protein NRT1/ PTR FAMILY 5.8 [Raphanus sativus]KAJ4882793.1 Protein NRT1/ PTR FAMILY 5.8 [Raphanus sativus]